MSRSQLLDASPHVRDRHYVLQDKSTRLPMLIKAIIHGNTSVLMCFSSTFNFFRFEDQAKIEGEPVGAIIEAQLLCKNEWFFIKGNGTIIVEHTSLNGGIIGDKVQLRFCIKEEFSFYQFFSF